MTEGVERSQRAVFEDHFLELGRQVEDTAIVCSTAGAA